MVHTVLKENFPNIIDLSWQFKSVPVAIAIFLAFLPLRRTHKFHIRGLGNAVCSPSEVWGGAPAEIEFGSI